MIKKDPTESIGKYANELRFQEKTVGTVIKQDSNPDINPFDYTMRGVLENKINATSFPNVGSLKTVIELEGKSLVSFLSQKS